MIFDDLFASACQTFHAMTEPHGHTDAGGGTAPGPVARRTTVVLSRRVATTSGVALCSRPCEEIAAVSKVGQSAEEMAGQTLCP